MGGLHEILAANVITCLEPLLNCQCHFKFILLRLRSKINVKKVQKQDLNLKRCSKQGRDDIMKVNVQSLIPASFFILVCNFTVKRCRDRAL